MEKKGEVMPYELEDLSWNEIDPELSKITSAIIGACIEVHRELGPGLDEVLYEAAIAEEFLLRGIPLFRQAIVPVFYKGKPIGEKRLDFLVADKVIVELKAVEALSTLHKAQLRTYFANKKTSGRATH
ncbi:hypothetical protein BH10PLA1_BH10PLA1_11830 [soil metagenome]